METDGKHYHQTLKNPFRGMENRQQRFGDLPHQPRADQVQAGHADDVAAFKLVQESIQFIYSRPRAGEELGGKNLLARHCHLKLDCRQLLRRLADLLQEWQPARVLPDFGELWLDHDVGHSRVAIEHGLG